MKFELLYYPYGSENTTAAVHAEADESRLKELYTLVIEGVGSLGGDAANAREYTDTFADPLDRDYDHSAPAKISFGCFENEKIMEAHEGNLYFSEEDAIAAALYGYILLDFSDDEESDIEADPVNNGGEPVKFERSPSVGVIIEGLTVTVDYKGDTYTNIHKVSMLDSSLGLCGIRFIGEKNGGQQNTYYLLTKTTLNDNQYREYTIVQSPSAGIIETGPKYRYAGNCLNFQTSLESSAIDFLCGDPISTRDEDGNKFCDYTKCAAYVSGKEEQHQDWANTAHLFFERNGEDFTFSVLKNGKLYKKISRTEDAVIFYGTTFSFAPDTDTDKLFDIVFRKTNGQYLNEECLILMTKYINSSIDMPTIPEGDKLKAADYSAFYDACVRSFYKAFENSERYYTTKYQWLSPLEGKVEEWSETTRKNLGTETPPACQLAISRGDNGKYVFAFEDATVTAHVSVSHADKNFRQRFYPAFPDFVVESVAFTENAGTVELRPANGQMYIQITDAKTSQTYEERFALLRMEPDFDNTGIPRNLYLGADWIRVKRNLDIYRKIKDAVIQFGIEKFETCVDDSSENRRDRIEELLYDEEGMVPDETVISMVVQFEKEFERTRQIPNIAIVGQAGTGKTTLAKKLGKIFGKDVLALTPSDLRGAYIGHTKYEVVQKLAEAAMNNQIFYVDEVYQLMDDRFGAEALTVLLPLMSGDRTKIDAGLDKGQNPPIEIDFKEGYVKKGDKVTANFAPGIVPIWISGYENEVRVMINRNQGLYRRLKKVIIKSPTTSDLFKKLTEELEKTAKGSDKAARNALMLKKYFNDNGSEAVKKFFGWGSQPQNSKYFANNAGVVNFLSNCLDSIDFGKDVGPQIEDIISSTKCDIKRQLAAVRIGSSNGNNAASDSSSAVFDAKDTIQVITDIDTRFSDLVGCSSQIAYMRSIIEMLINKSVYEDYNLTVPKGALMEGLPGVGKTFIARAMAGELEQHFQEEAPDKRFGFMSFSASELGNKPASYIASIFNTAEEYDACVLFIDEVDAIAKHRNENSFYDRYLELIKQMDGIEKRSNVFILAATNALENLDPAFVRSGRIDKRLEFILPDKDSRKELAGRAIKKRIKTLVNFVPGGKEEDIDVIAELIAKKTSGHTAGDIDNMINTAFIMYHQFNRYGTHIDEFNGLIDRDFFKSYPFIECSQNKRLEISVKDKNRIKDSVLSELYLFIEEEIERTQAGVLNYKKREQEFNTEKNGNCSSVAIHEVGHAVMSMVVGEKLFDVITTLPRGDSLGYVSHSELELVTKADYENRIRVLMGGRIAEEIIYGKDNISTGAVSDMRKATECARAMIERWGFSDKFGFMALSVPAGRYLGRNCNYTCSEEFRMDSDIAVNELLQKLYRETLGMLSDKKELIKNLAKHVFEKETMSGDEFKEFYQAQQMQN